MSVKELNKKVVIKGNMSPSPKVIYMYDRQVNCSLPLWQLDIIEAICEKLENENGCEVWYGYMKD